MFRAWVAWLDRRQIERRLSRRSIIGLRWGYVVVRACRRLSSRCILRRIMSIRSLTALCRAWRIWRRGREGFDRGVSPGSSRVLLAKILSRGPLLVVRPGRVLHLVVWICILHRHVLSVVLGISPHVGRTYWRDGHRLWLRWNRRRLVRFVSIAGIGRLLLLLLRTIWGLGISGLAL